MNFSFAQNTVGVLKIEPNQVSEGYNLFTPHFQGSVFLMNNCGQIVHEWQDTIYKPGNTVYLQEDASLIRCGTRGAVANPDFQAGGAGEMIEKLDWDGSLIWRYFINDSINRMHHDISILPNGNIVLIAWEKKFINDLFLAGRDTSNLINDELWSEQILEIKPVTVDSFQIVWEWHAWDHLIQDFDSSKANFGVVADFSERINLNYGDNGGFADWLHFNSIDYNEDLDQIMVSVPFFNEIWIIDHSTTTAEATTNIGGNANKGGDLIFRWGNPLAYQTGSVLDQKLFFQHDAHWLDDFLETTDTDYGKIAVFNNRVNSNYSSINLIDVEYDETLNLYPKTSNIFEPLDFDFTYVRPDTAVMYTKILGGMQKFNNGNILICTGSQGNIFEINEQQEIVWEYENPMIFGNLVSQGSATQDGDNLVFRMTRYSENYPAFIGKDLSPIKYLELNPTPICNDTASSISSSLEDYINIGPNPFVDAINLSLSKQIETDIAIYDVLGKQIYHSVLKKTSLQINTSSWTKGIYFVRIANSTKNRIFIKE